MKLPKGRPTKTAVTKDRAAPASEPTAKAETRKYILKLYVTGATLNSRRAVENIRAICEEHLAGRYELDVIDIYKHPSLASGEQILAAPTLIKKLPEPLRRIIGDMSNLDKVLLGLDLQPKKTSKGAGT